MDPAAAEDGRSSADDGEEPIFMLESDNPLLVQVQKALEKQLLQTKAKTEEHLRDKVEEYKRVKQKREDIGVELYQFQQQLALLQEKLLQAHDNLNEEEKRRIAQEEKNQEQLEHTRGLRAAVEEEEATAQARHRELEQLNAGLRQLHQLNTAREGDIAVVRRTTYKIEEQVTDLEKDKKAQDLLIDTLQQKLCQLRQEYAEYDTRIVSQRQETVYATEALEAATAEMSSIYGEKAQLVQRWRSCLTSIKHLDDKLEQLQQQLSKMGEEEKTLDWAIIGHKQAINDEHAMHERLSAILNRTSTERTWLQKQLIQVREKRQALQANFSEVRGVLEITEEELALARQDLGTLTHMLRQHDAYTANLSRETAQLRNQHMDFQSTQKTVQQGQKRALAEIRNLSEVMAEREAEGNRLHNDISATKVELLSVQAEIEAKEAQLRNLVVLLQDKEALIDKYQHEITHQHDVIEKKQTQVDQLNRQCEADQSKMEATDNRGPLHALEKLRKQVRRRTEECAELQRRWIRKQTELLSLTATNSKLQDTVAELRAETTVIGQKRRRLYATFNETDKQMNELRNGIRVLNSELARLGARAGSNTGRHAELHNETFVLELEFSAKLKEMEEDAIRMAASINRHLSDIEQKNTEVLETRREIMQLEKKIEQQQQHQTLDPLQQREIEDLKQENTRKMKKLKSIEKKQDIITKAMEKAILKRDIIQTKVQANKGVGAAHTAHKNTMADLTRRLKQTTDESKHSASAISQLKAKMAEAARQAEQLQHQNMSTAQQAEEVTRAMLDSAFERSLLFETKCRLQRMIKRLEAPPKPTKPEPELDAALLAEQQKTTELLRVANQLRGLHPDLQPQVDRLSRFAHELARS
eukprot:gnl/Spiro4/1634_TR862_c0_g1_i1.p1 gnl/Spiro4/1634_TR862_c0_g1~~gnl/Spiro4/1634_TR862_c0_g1_i1.p1  ORF type:complete len:871 (+),score=364.36 gnl/Spiro4/1634_TR862_c0_g1_i1:244-2856(+)